LPSYPSSRRHFTVLEYAADRRVTINAQPVELAALEPRLPGAVAVTK